MWKKILGLGASKEEKDLVSLYDKVPEDRRPRHVAIIMDGNGRWAEGKGLLRTAGHAAGVKTLERIMEICVDLHIEVLTVYAFSTENWKRPRPEVDFLMNLFSEYLDKKVQKMDDNHVQLRFLGREDGMSPMLLEKMHATVARLAKNDGMVFNIAANYDPPVDLVIRTSGDLRLSNFLLWQAAYAEFWFTKTNWPDFTPEEFVDALVAFAHRKRRFGGLDKK